MRNVLVIYLVLARCVCAQEPAKEVARITATEPATLVTGAKASLKVRGFQLKDATEFRLPKHPDLKVEIKEKKDAGQTNGLDNKVVGATQLLAEITLPPDFQLGVLDFVVATSAGEAAGSITVLSAANTLEEKEPNDGFQEPQRIVLGQSVKGSIQKEKDVDVYELTAKAGQKISVSVTGGSVMLMDAALNCYGTGGELIAVCDDAASRHPVTTITPKVDGPIFLCVSDAHDKGGEWHSYFITAEEAK